MGAWARLSPLTRGLFGVGLGISLIYALLALLAPLLLAWGWLADPTVFLDYPVQAPPSAAHIFGTDRLGYDILSRTVFAARAAWGVVLAATGLSLLVGVPLGLVSGYLGGRLDRGLLFVMDTLYTLPGLLLSLSVAFVVGRGVVNAALALSIAYIPQYYRLVRNQTVSLKQEVFVDAVRALGATPVWVLRRHLLGHVAQNLPVLFSLNAADAILTLAGLGFLGLGLPPDVPEWGYDLRQALDALPVGIWWATFFPGAAMTLLVVGLSLVGEGLQELAQGQS
ncbi:MAG: ABC transporter permease [Gloeomargaritaceae cyanobacterium C42_A2020_066]|nr:ABC transporter permease [Gloeomargaritaceae cyanobacterium C42_A2020_066]